MDSIAKHCKNHRHVINPFQPAFMSGMIFGGVVLHRLFPQLMGAGWASRPIPVSPLPSSSALSAALVDSSSGLQTAASLTAQHLQYSGPTILAVSTAVLGGLLMGIGARLSNGCTSGHGVCGLPRFSRRSFVATSMWFLTAPFAAILMSKLYQSGIGSQLVSSLSSFSSSSSALLQYLPSSQTALLLAATSLAAYAFYGVSRNSHLRCSSLSHADTYTTVGLSMLFGSLFSVGLALSGMANPDRVIGFLDPVYRKWDPSMAFVFGGALGVNIPAFHYILKREKPLLLSKFNVPTSKTIDFNLVGGAAMFGIGWGIGGLCPGPAILSLTSANPLSWIWFSSLLVGMRVGNHIVNPLSAICSAKKCDTACKPPAKP
eukprot:TRINITY_DN4469_c0_g1_i1.p1 TRINITY_DN4469_c0_g1~~TRINITY_DN4469_c0_g1_i1.p1  ORF type:complete len:429 (+),score=97.24 TRINITY_DN4469_c0_g1_i1:166-1287(+)